MSDTHLSNASGEVSPKSVEQDLSGHALVTPAAAVSGQEVLVSGVVSAESNEYISAAESKVEDLQVLTDAHRAQSARYSSLESRLVERERAWTDAQRRERELSKEVEEYQARCSQVQSELERKNSEMRLKAQKLMNINRKLER
eukprot:13136_1